MKAVVWISLQEHGEETYLWVSLPEDFKSEAFSYSLYLELPKDLRDPDLIIHDDVYEL